MTRTCHRILLIEDNTDSAEAFRTVLEMAGFEVVVAFHGADALAILRYDRNFCTILLDLMMPVMDGWEFRAEQLKDPALAEIPVIVISADAQAEDHAARIGAVAYLKKPFEFQQLTNMIGSA
jgi:CheY-like chemotaxis protein